jgi:hypothetical protein
MEILMVLWHRELSKSGTERYPMIKSDLQAECPSEPLTVIWTSMVTKIPSWMGGDKTGQPSGRKGTTSVSRGQVPSSTTRAPGQLLLTRMGLEGQVPPQPSGALTSHRAASSSLWTSLFFHSTSLASVSTKPGQSSSHPDKAHQYPRKPIVKAIITYDDDHPTADRITCDVLSPDIALRDGELYDRRSSAQYRRTDSRRQARGKIKHPM